MTLKEADEGFSLYLAGELLMSWRKCKSFH